MKVTNGMKPSINFTQNVHRDIPVSLGLSTTIMTKQNNNKLYHSSSHKSGGVNLISAIQILKQEVNSHASSANSLTLYSQLRLLLGCPVSDLSNNAHIKTYNLKIKTQLQWWVNTR